MDNRNGAKWIWLQHDHGSEYDIPGRFVLFRKTIEVALVPSKPCQIHVSADTRYRLYINGRSVAFGPCKSYPTRWYYETVDVTPFLVAGTNIITAKVLRFFADQIGSSSHMRANIPGFILWGNIEDTPLVTDGSWLCREDTSIKLQPRSEWNYMLGPPFLSLDEAVDLRRAQSNSDAKDADLSEWSPAGPVVALVKMMPALEPWKLFPRPIPMLPEVPMYFTEALRASGNQGLKAWNELLSKQRTVVVASGQEIWVEIESSVLTTGFLELDFTGGQATELTVLYAESYEKDLGVDRSPFPLPRCKGDRRDWKNGRLYGNEDHVVLAAAADELTRYEPFWFRTFRFIRLSIKCKETPLAIRRIAFRETHYPLEITTQVRLPPELKQIWDISLNTLRNCMHETYEDCPFYEQNQFAMDGRLQLLFTYQLSRDDRLARKTIHEFFASRREDGLLETNFPVSFRAINIPQFSLFWILMLHDHMMYFGDVGLVRRYTGTADGILDYFDGLLNEDGLVGPFDPECWAFVDWVKEWHGSKGIRDMAVPPAYKRTGVAAYNSLVYAWTLQHAAELCAFIGRDDTAGEYLQRADCVNQAVAKHCFNGEYFTDGPAHPDLSEHTQIFAILSGAITGDAAVQLLKRTINNSSIPRCSYAMKHYVFRALEKTDLYDTFFDAMVEPWAKMVKNNMTTFAEDDVNFRSDCHGWSASTIYEIVAVVYGIRPVRAGFGKVCIKPRRRVLEEAQLQYRLPRGEVSARWSDGGEVKVECPDGVDIEVLSD